MTEISDPAGHYEAAGARVDNHLGYSAPWLRPRGESRVHSKLCLCLSSDVIPGTATVLGTHWNTRKLLSLEE